MSDDVIYDWNVQGPHHVPTRTVEIHDETLRDGIQCPSVRDPSIDDKLAIVRLLAQLGVDTPSSFATRSSPSSSAPPPAPTRTTSGRSSRSAKPPGSPSR
jgi:hypothetical protein